MTKTDVKKWYRSIRVLQITNIRARVCRYIDNTIMYLCNCALAEIRSNTVYADTSDVSDWWYDPHRRNCAATSGRYNIRRRRRRAGLYMLPHIYYNIYIYANMVYYYTMCNAYMRTASNLQQHCIPPLNRNIHVDFYIDGESDREKLRQRDI